MSIKRHCYFIPVGQDADSTGGYVPAVIHEGESGYAMMMGRDEFSMPWVWGKTLEEAEKTAESFNQSRLKLTTEDVDDIIFSSMRHNGSY